MAVDRHCSKAEDGFHTWDLDLDLHKVVCVHCEQPYDYEVKEEHKHVYIQNKLVGDGKVRCVHCDKEFEPRFDLDLYSTKSQEIFTEKVVLGRKHFKFMLWFAFTLGYVLGVVIPRLFWWLLTVGSAG